MAAILVVHPASILTFWVSFYLTSTLTLLQDYLASILTSFLAFYLALIPDLTGHQMRDGTVHPIRDPDMAGGDCQGEGRVSSPDPLNITKKSLLVTF